MDSKFYFEQFCDKYNELVTALSTIFPKTKNITDTKANLDKTDMKQVLENYTEVMGPYYKRLSEKDMKIFNDDKEFFKTFDISQIMKKLKKENKEIMWQYLQILYLTGTCCDGQKEPMMPPNPVEFIKSNLSDGKMEEMNEELTNLKPEDLNEACNSISSLVGDNDGVISSIFDEIQNELKNPTPREEGETSESAQMMQQMFNLKGAGFNNLISIFENVSKKVSTKIESGELDVNQLQQTAQKMMANLAIPQAPQAQQAPQVPQTQQIQQTQQVQQTQPAQQVQQTLQVQQVSQAQETSRKSRRNRKKK